MTPAARIAAAIALLDELFAAWQQERRVPADKLIDMHFKAHRYIGSHDRGAISELTYWVIRRKAEVEWWCGRQHITPTARALVLAALLLRHEAAPAQLAALFSGGKYAPLPLTDREWQFVHYLAKQPASPAEMPSHIRLNYPTWLEKRLAGSLGASLEKEMLAMHEQAPVDLRVNTLKISREDLIKKLYADGFDATPATLTDTGIRLAKRGAIFASPLFKEGFFEMQDEGSQAVAQLCSAQPGMKVIDFCAGAGGKTLALAAAMHNKGRLLAWDTSEKRLAQLPPRLKRAGVWNTEWRAIKSETDPFIKRHKFSADRVLVDAPCSGSGTWRRNPDLKWRFTAKDLEEVIDAQRRILESASRLVKPGGWMIYATCSLLSCENQEQVEAFLKAHENFRVVCAKKIWNKTVPDGVTETDMKNANEKKPVSYLWLTPHQDGTDGFFAAVLQRAST